MDARLRAILAGMPSYAFEHLVSDITREADELGIAPDDMAAFTEQRALELYEADNGPIEERVSVPEFEEEPEYEEEPMQEPEPEYTPPDWSQMSPAAIAEHQADRVRGDRVIEFEVGEDGRPASSKDWESWQVATALGYEPDDSPTEGI